MGGTSRRGPEEAEAQGAAPIGAAVIPAPRRPRDSDFRQPVRPGAAPTHPARRHRGARVTSKFRGTLWPALLGVAGTGALVGRETLLAAWQLALVIVVTLLVHFQHGRQTIRPALPHYGRIVRDASIPFALAGAAASLHLFTTQALFASGQVVMAMTAATLALTWGRRWLTGPVRVLVVGDQMAIGEAAIRWTDNRQVRLVGAVRYGDTGAASGRHDVAGIPTIAGLDHVADWARTCGADSVIVWPGPSTTSTDIQRLSWMLERSRVALSLTSVLDAVAPHRVETTSLAGVTFLNVRASRAAGPVRLGKVVIDKVLGSVLLLLLSPLLALTLLAIRRESPGPGIFTQTRVGQHGRRFTMYKLRTMRQGAEAERTGLIAANQGNGHLFKLHADPRVTRLGRVLRKFSVDEIPQLVNVILGDMSLVGPRPALPEEVARYSGTELRRLAVRPGMTGLWQVKGRSLLRADEALDLDLHYTDNWRITDDALILMQTVKAVVKPVGAF